MSSSNIYNILSKLNALQPKAEEPKAQATKPIYESVESRGSIMSGVAGIEKKLSEAYVAEKAKNPYAVGMAQAMKSTGDNPPLKKSTITKAHDIAKKVDENGMPMDTNPKNADWDADAIAKQKARLAREKQKIGMQRKISGQDTGLPPAMDEDHDHDDEEEGDVCPECDGEGCPECYGDEHVDRAHAHAQGMQRESAATVKYGVFRKGGSIGGDNSKPIKTFDSKEEAMAFAKERRSGLSKGERGYYRMSYVVKAIKGVAEGWDDMIKAGKARDAETRSGKKSTTTGVKHHGKYGTEYQGDADEEEAAAKAADKGPKKRGRPAKGLAKPKPAAGEKKGRGRPKKAAEPTYSGAKDLQNYIVGNLPKGKQAKGTVHRMDEGRIMDESGQQLEHILNRFKHEVKQFEQGGDLDQDLYHALFDYWNDLGEIPYGVQKSRTGDPYEWVCDNLESHLSGGGIVGGNPWDDGDGMERESVEPAVIAPAFKPGDRVLYMGTFATVVTCDGETCGIKIDKHPGTMMVPVSNLKKPSYDESSAVPVPAMESELNELAKLAGLTVEAEEPLEEGTCDKCDCSPCECNEGNAFGAAVAKAKADGVQPGEKVKVGGKSYAVREAEEMINFMRNAGLDTSRAEMALAEAYKYGDTDVEEGPEYANSPDEEIENVEAITRQGNDLNREKKQYAGKPKAGDNPMASESSDPLEAMGRRLMAAYESIKVVDEGIVDKVKGMFGKKAPADGTGNLFDQPHVKADTKAYLKKSAKQPGGPNPVKNIFDK